MKVEVVYILILLNLICFSEAGPGKNDSRIVGGFEADKEDYPYVVSLRTSSNHHTCGGTLINPHYVVTAAHCIKGGHVKSVVVGSDSLDSGGTKYRVLSSRIHPQYNELFSKNDIAVLKIEKATTYKSFFPRRMQTAIFDYKNPCYVMGWGLTSAGGHLSKKFKVAGVKPVTPDRCKLEWRQMYNPNVICMSSEGNSTCQGDSGGPLICSDRLTGVVSFGKPCATGKPDVFTAVKSYNAWIDSVMDVSFRFWLENQKIIF